MEYRRLIKFGNSSFVVSVPKDWLRKNHLEKGDMIYMNENGNNELVLVPNLPQQERELKEATVQIDGKSVRRIKRELISAYLNDYNIVTLTGKDIEKHAKDIRDIIQNLMALEITEQTKDKIVTQDFLNLREVSPNDIIRKMDIITRSMVGDLHLGLEKNIVPSIEQREQDVNRMSYVILRVVRRGLHDPEYAKSLKLLPLQLFELWNIGSQIELVADEIREVNIMCQSAGKLTSQQKGFLTTLFGHLEKAYLQVMKAFYNRDLDLANEVSSHKNEVIDSCRGVFQLDESLKNPQHDKPKYICTIERSITLLKEINKIARRIYS